MSFTPRSGNGTNAYTTTSSNFTMPASGSTVSVSVVTTAWMAVGQRLSVATAGYMTVSSITNTTTVVLTNNGDTGNAASSTTINSGSAISPSALIGVVGSAGASTPHFSYVNWQADVGVGSSGISQGSGSLTTGIRFTAIGSPVCTGVRFFAIPTATYRCRIYKQSDSSVVASVDLAFTTVKGIGLAKFAASVTLSNGVDYFATVWDTAGSVYTLSSNHTFNTLVLSGTAGFVNAEENISYVNCRYNVSGNACPTTISGTDDYPVEPYFG